MNPPDPSLEDIISSLTELKQLADGHGLNDIGELIGHVLVAATDASQREAGDAEPEFPFE